MGKLYDEGYVGCIDYNEFTKDVDSLNLELNPNDLTTYTCYQHALLKYLDKGVTSNKMLYLLSFYDTFKKRPYLFAMSPLLDNSIIDRYIPEKDKKKIYQVRNSYFNKDIIESLADKDELYESEKNRLYSGLIRNTRIFSNTIKNEDVVKKILSKYSKDDKNRSIKDLSDIELQFLAFYFIRCNLEKFNVFITTEHPNIPFKEKNGVIRINRDAKANDSIEEFIYNSCYASKVANEYSKPTKNLVTQYEVALDELFLKYLDEADYAAYVEYYKYSDIDNECKREGTMRAAVGLGMLQRGDLEDIIMGTHRKDINSDNKVLYHKDLGFKPSMLANKQGLPSLEFPADSFIIKRLDSIISEHPEELKNYPILNKFYNQDGNRKSFKKLFNLRMNDNKNFVHIYDTFINRGILDGGLAQHIDKDGNYYEQFSLPSSESEAYKVFDLLAKINEYKAENLNAILSTPSATNEKEEEYIATPLGYTVMNYINQIAQIQEYVIRNSSTLIDLIKKKGSINKESILYSFVKSVKDIDFEKITNPGLLNDNYVMYCLISLKVINNELTSIFNKAFVDQLMENVTQEEKDRLFYKESGESIRFEDYVYNEVLPNIQGVEYVKGDSRIYVKSLIKKYSESFENEENKGKKH